MTANERSLRIHVEAAGRPPGQVVVPAGAVPPRIRVTLYDRDRHEVLEDAAAADLPALLADEQRNVWVDVAGLGDAKVLDTLISVFDVPWLAMEDVLHSPQRPKVDAYGEARFLVVRMLDRPGTCEMDQFSIWIRGRTVLTFQERPGDPFGPIRKRLAQRDSQARQRGPDYLVYRFVDACVDSFFPELQRLSEQVEAIEDQAIERPNAKLLRDLHQLRRDLRTLERVALGTRDMASALARDEEGFFDHATRPYLRDVLDHASQVVDLTHYYTSVANDIGSFIVGSLDLKMNQVMRVLAAVTVVFMPLTLIAGIYGMNFENMPETKTSWGYFAAIGLILLLGAMLTLWLKRRGWMGGDGD